MSDNILPPLPSSWSALTWQQLWNCWTAKLRFGGNADAAAVAAMLCLVQGARFKVQGSKPDERTGENIYTIEAADGRLWTATPRELAFMASKTMKWFAFPYGDRGDDAVKDEQGKVVKEARDPVRGYVNPNWRDAMQLPEQEVVVWGREIVAGSKFAARADFLRPDGSKRPKAERQSDRTEYKDLKSAIKRIANAHTPGDGIANPAERAERSEAPIHFALPEVACNNITWHQYRSLQAMTQMLFQDGIDDATATDLQAQFLAAILVPEQMGRHDGDRFARPHPFRYDADRAAQTVGFWRPLLTGPDAPAAPLYAICFQAYHTALHYYEQVFPLLFHGSGKDDPLHDALTGEVDTINSVMKYQGYTDPQQVYDANLPIILSVLNTMTKEAKEIEKMNAKIKRK